MGKLSIIMVIVFLFACKNDKQTISNQTIEDFNVFKLKRIDSTNSITVTALSFINGKVYYFTSDSLLMSNLNLENGKIVLDLPNLKYFNSINIDSVQAIKNYDKCNCGSMTKTEFIIRASQDKNRFAILDEVFDCSPNSPCALIEKISKTFSEMELRHQ